MERIPISRFIEKRDVKSYLVSILVGVVVGFFCLAFRWGINFLQELRVGFWSAEWPVYFKIPLYIIVVYPILLFVNRLITDYPVVAGNGAEQTRGMLNGHLHHSNAFLFLMRKFIGAICSLGSGMALGREGPSIQFGGYWGIIISKICRITPGREEYLISAGASAGIAAALDASLAGPVYIIESLQKLNNYRTAICALLAGLTSGLLASVFMPANAYDQIRLIRPAVPDLHLLGFFAGMGTVLAVLGLLFTVFVAFIRRQFNHYPARTPFRLFFLAVCIAILGSWIPSLPGSGQEFMIAQALNSSSSVAEAALYVVVFFIFTAYSQGTTFPGGAFLPLLTLGGLTGRLFALILVSHGWCGMESVPYFMFLGMSGCFVVIMRTPLTGFLLVTEMTSHYEILLPALAVGIIGYFLISIVRIQSLPAELYNNLLDRIRSKDKEWLTIYMEVMPYSYFEGRNQQTVNLPYGCKISNLLRNKAIIPFDKDETLRAGDQIVFSVLNAGVERIYPALLSMASDQA